MAEFPLPDPRLAKILLASGDFECSLEISAIAAVSQVGMETALNGRISIILFQFLKAYFM
jgi:HrpA-like RNA helicase